MNKQYTYNHKKIEKELRDRGLWHSFITGPGYILERSSEKASDLFILFRGRGEDTYCWFWNLKKETTLEECLEIIRSHEYGDV